MIFVLGFYHHTLISGGFVDWFLSLSHANHGPTRVEGKESIWMLCCRRCLYYNLPEGNLHMCWCSSRFRSSAWKPPAVVSLSSGRVTRSFDWETIYTRKEKATKAELSQTRKLWHCRKPFPCAKNLEQTRACLGAGTVDHFPHTFHCFLTLNPKVFGQNRLR